MATTHANVFGDDAPHQQHADTHQPHEDTPHQTSGNKSSGNKTSNGSQDSTETTSISQDDAASSPIQSTLSSQSEDSALLRAFKERSVPTPIVLSNPPSRPSTARLSLRAISHIYSAVRGGSTSLVTNVSQDATTWQGPFEQLPSNSSDASARPTPRGDGDARHDGESTSIDDGQVGETAAAINIDQHDGTIVDAAQSTADDDTGSHPTIHIPAIATHTITTTTTTDNPDQGAPILQGTYMGFPILYIGNSMHALASPASPPAAAHQTHPLPSPMTTPRTRPMQQRSSHFDVVSALQSPPGSAAQTPRDGQRTGQGTGQYIGQQNGQQTSVWLQQGPSSLAARVRARLHRLLADALLVSSFTDVYAYGGGGAGESGGEKGAGAHTHGGAGVHILDTPPTASSSSAPTTAAPTMIPAPATTATGNNNNDTTITISDNSHAISDNSHTISHSRLHMHGMSSSTNQHSSSTNQHSSSSHQPPISSSSSSSGTGTGTGIGTGTGTDKSHQHTSLEQLLEETVRGVVTLCVGHQHREQQGVAQLQALHTQCAALKEQVQLLQQQWEDAQAAATQAKEQLAVLKAQHTGLQHKYKAAKAARAQHTQEQHAELSIAQERAHTLEQHNTRLAKQLAAAHREAAGAKEAATAAAQRARKHAHEASIQIQALQQRVHTLQQQQAQHPVPPPHHPRTPPPTTSSPTPTSPRPTPTRPPLNTTPAFAALRAAYQQQHARTRATTNHADARLRVVLSSKSATTRDPAVVASHVRRLCRLAAAHGVPLVLQPVRGVSGCWKLNKGPVTLVLQVADARVLARTGGGWEDVIEVAGRVLKGG